MAALILLRQGDAGRCRYFGGATHSSSVRSSFVTEENVQRYQQINKTSAAKAGKVGMGKVMFSVCLSVNTSGVGSTLSPSYNISTGPMFFLGGVP